MAFSRTSQMVSFRFHQYQVVGSALPTENNEHPKIYRMKLWVTNEICAKSKFWYFMRKLKKVKKSNEQMLAINEIFEKNRTKINNYGIWLRYQSRTGYLNMCKELPWKMPPDVYLNISLHLCGQGCLRREECYGHVRIYVGIMEDLVLCSLLWCLLAIISFMLVC